MRFYSVYRNIPFLKAKSSVKKKQKLFQAYDYVVLDEKKNGKWKFNLVKSNDQHINCQL